MRAPRARAVALLLVLLGSRATAQTPAWAPTPPSAQKAGAIPGPPVRKAGEPPAPDGTSALWRIPHYDKGFVLVSTPEPSEYPFRLRLNHVSQFRYTNNLATNETYTDHFGVEHDVQRRHDIQLVRDAFYFTGFVFSEKLDFNILVFTSSATLVATAAGYVGYKFHPKFRLRAGYFSLPSARSMSGTYPFFHGMDRSMANNYMRPGFTQGVWADTELGPGFNYIAMVGNSLNTLDIKAGVIDNHLAYSLSVWYDLNEFGMEWNDFERHDSIALRLGTAFTYSREDRLSNTDLKLPENNATFISDGHFLFETGALAPDVTIQLADFYLSAIDVGIKYRGLAFNAELYQRWLNRFRADGPLPIDSMYDWGFEASLGYFVVPHRVEPYVRSSFIHGPYADAVEGVIGVHWYPFGTRWVWLTAEAIAIKNSPYFSGYYVYAVGQTGFLFPVQLLLRF